jgi:hypothetical protein
MTGQAAAETVLSFSSPFSSYFQREAGPIDKFQQVMNDKDILWYLRISDDFSVF